MDSTRGAQDVGDPCRGDDDPGHGKPPVPDRPWMVDRRSTEERGAVGLCACGCGNTIELFTIHRRPRRYCKGHGGIRVDWEERARAIHASAPLCACGCGQAVVFSRDVRKYRVRTPKWPRFLQGHGKSHGTRAAVLEPSQEGLLLGTLLGDAGIYRASGTNRSARVVFRHGPAQYEWARYKTRRLGVLQFQCREVRNGGYGTTLLAATSRSLPCLNPVWQLVGQPKKVTSEWLERLTDEGWAWWYMDDGSITRTSIRFHTEGFDLGEVTAIRDSLRRLGFDPQIDRSKGRYYYIRLRTRDTILWCDRFARYAAPGLEYKFRYDRSVARRV